MEKLMFLINQHLQSKNISEDNLPWIIASSNLSGRGLFATRDIQVGEIILKDSPIIIGPRASIICPIICVACYKRVDLYACSKKCGLPVCSQKCEDSASHEKECKLISSWNNNNNNNEFVEMNIPLLKCLTPVRSLFLNDIQRELLKLLKSHSGPEHCLEVDILKEKLRLSFSEEEEDLMRLSCLVLDANSYEVTVGNEEKQASLRGLYPLSSMMNHSCVPNSMHIFDSNQNMVVKATNFIPEGEEIFVSYTRVYWGTSIRRTHLLRTKNFLCKCARCEDPTEFGTYLSAINCFKCHQGSVLPLFVNKSNMVWKCTWCEEEIPSRKAGMIISVLGSSLDSFRSAEPEEILHFLKTKLAKHLPLTSQIAIELKYKLVWILGYEKKYLWNDISSKLLDEKKNICQELLLLLTKLRAGKSKMRGLLLYELYCCLREQHRRRVLHEPAENMSEDENKELEELFEESREILIGDVHAPKEINYYNLTNKKG